LEWIEVRGLDERKTKAVGTDCCAPVGVYDPVHRLDVSVEALEHAPFQSMGGGHEHRTIYANMAVSDN
jgi:hypothetical protein